MIRTLDLGGSYLEEKGAQYLSEGLCQNTVCI